MTPIVRIVANQLEYALVLAFFLGLYTFTSSPNLSEAHDSVTYINNIDNGHLFHAHHLLYGWFGAIWLDLWRAFGFQGDSALPVRLLNSVFGALTVLIVYALFRRALPATRLIAIIAAALVGCSFGVWFYSVTIEVYVIPLFFLMLAFTLLVRGRDKPRTYLAVGVLHGLAILFHQVHVLFAAVVVGAAFLSRPIDRRSFLKASAYYATTIIPVVALPYALVLFLHYGYDTISGAMGWLIGYAGTESYWRSPGLSTVPAASIGLGRAMIGGHFAFAVPWLANWAAQFLPGKWLSDEAFLVRHMSATVANLLVLHTVAFVALTVATAVRAVLGWRRAWSTQHPLLGLAVVWLVTYTAFFLFWEPTNLEFWIPQTVVIWIVIVTLCVPNPRERLRGPWCGAWVLGILAGLLLFINLAGSIFWLSNQDNDYYGAKTHALAAASAPEDLIIIGRSWIISGYLRRATDAEIVALTSEYRPGVDHRDATARLRERIQTALQAGRTVLVSSEAVDIEPGVVRTSGADILSVADALWAPYREKWDAVGEGLQRFYVLRQP